MLYPRITLVALTPGLLLSSWWWSALDQADLFWKSRAWETVDIRSMLVMVMAWCWDCCRTTSHYLSKKLIQICRHMFKKHLAWFIQEYNPTVVGAVMWNEFLFFFRLISEKTVEENILKKANQKRLLGNVAIEGGNFTTAYFKEVSNAVVYPGSTRCRHIVIMDLIIFHIEDFGGALDISTV